MEGGRAPVLCRGPAVGMAQAPAWDRVSSCPLCLSLRLPLSLSRSFRRGARTEDLRRVRNNKQMAAECFLHGGRPLNDSNVARKAGINDDGENSVTMTHGLQGQLRAHGIPAPATSWRRNTARPSGPTPPSATTSPNCTGIIGDSSEQNYRDQDTLGRWLSCFLVALLSVPMETITRGK